MVGLEDFGEYYNIVSAAIEDDSYFELILINTWNVHKVSYGKGWGAQ